MSPASEIARSNDSGHQVSVLAGHRSDSCGPTYLTEVGQFSFFGLQLGAATESPISAAWPVPSPELSTWVECVRFIHVTVRFTHSTLDSIRHLSATPPCSIGEAGADCARGQDGGDGKAGGGQHNRRHCESQADHGCERKPDQATPAERATSATTGNKCGFNPANDQAADRAHHRGHASLQLLFGHSRHHGCGRSGCDRPQPPEAYGVRRYLVFGRAARSAWALGCPARAGWVGTGSGHAGLK